MFECSCDGKKFGLVFVEAKAWLLRTRLFSETPSHSPVAGIGWLRVFVQETTRTDHLEIHGDSGTS